MAAPEQEVQLAIGVLGNSVNEGAVGFLHAADDLQIEYVQRRIHKVRVQQAAAGTVAAVQIAEDVFALQPGKVITPIDKSADGGQAALAELRRRVLSDWIDERHAN